MGILYKIVDCIHRYVYKESQKEYNFSDMILAFTLVLWFLVPTILLCETIESLNRNVKTER